MTRRFLVAVAATAIALVGWAPAANADYPPTGGTASISCSPSTVAPGETITCTYSGLFGTVTVSWGPSSAAGFLGVRAESGSVSGTADGSGTASFSISTPGRYTVTATGTNDEGESASAATTVTVTEGSAAGLPQTGSDNIAMLAGLGMAALAIGGLAIVGSRARRTSAG